MSQTTTIAYEELNEFDWDSMFVEDGDEAVQIQSNPEWAKAAEEQLPAGPVLIQRNGKAQEFFPANESHIDFDSWRRVDTNLMALKTLKQLIADNRYASEAEQEQLAAYTGWEGIDFSSSTALHSHLTAEELQDLSVQPQFPYAPKQILTTTILKILRKTGFKSGNLLISGAGNGYVLRALPQNMISNSRITLDAADRLNADILSLLYPKTEVKRDDEILPESYFDAAITYAPAFPVGEKKAVSKRSSMILPNYAASMMRTVNAVRPGGLILLMMDSDTADKMYSTVPFLFSSTPLKFIGGLRFDKYAFNNGKSNDLFLFVKSDRKGFIGGENFQFKFGLHYFVSHPEHFIVRQNVSVSVPHQKVYLPYDESTQLKKIEAAINEWNCKDIYQEIKVDEETEDTNFLPAIPGVKNFGMVLMDGAVYQRVDSRMIRQKLNGKALARITGMIAIRNQAKKVIEAELAECSDARLEMEQKQLNSLYDAFVKEYGYLSSPVNLRLFREDAEASILASLEYTNADDEICKSDLFSRRTIRVRKPVVSCDTPQEALLVCLDQKEWVDISYIAKLCNMTEAAVIAELQGTMIFRNPASGFPEDFWLPSDQYLSGNVRKKLEEARQAANLDPAFQKNVAALEAAQPALVPIEDIDIGLGVPFLDRTYIQAFLWEAIGNRKVGTGPNDFQIEETKKGIKISFSKYIPSSNPEIYSIYGTPKYSALWLVERLVNKKQIIAKKDEIGPDGKVRAVADPEETVVLQEKAQLIENKFKEWILSDPIRSAEIVEQYNREFNSIVVPKYDGSHLTFPGMSADIQLKPHQKNAVYRILRENGALIGHVVGAGKTITLLAAGMELKRIGRIHKPLFLVPNNLLAQWGGEMMRLYPTANILLASPDDMRKNRRDRFLARMATGDYDAIILGSSSFRTIPAPADVVQQSIEHIAQLAFEKKYPVRPKHVFVRDMIPPRINEEVFRNFIANNEAEYNLRDLGVDYLFVDESHDFKNLYAPSKGDNSMHGLTNTSSAKAMDLYFKTKYLASLYGGKGGFTFATGTAIVNTIVELYSLQRYFQEEVLVEKGIFTIQDWLSIFGNTTTEWELPPEGLDENGAGFRQVTRVSSFKNVPELMKMVLQFLDTVTRDEINMQTPEVITQTVSCPASFEQKEYMRTLVQRANAIRNRTVRRQQDNMLSVTVDGRKAALDIRVILPDAPESKTGKVIKCAKKIVEIYQRYHALRGTQVVFSDISTPNQQNFSIYRALKEKLVELGIPAEEIAFAHDFKTPKQQTTMRLKMQSGKFRVLIGSTATAGQGVNIQARLVALHNLDTPWIPKDIEQRLGRIERPGNMNATVYVYNYVTEGSFDAYMWQGIEIKAKFISQILRGDLSHRTIEDVDARALSYSEIKALATGDTRFLQRAKMEGEISRLEALQRNFEAQRTKLRQDVNYNLPKTIGHLQKLIPLITDDMAMIQSFQEDPLIECNGKQFHLSDPMERAAAAQEFQTKISKSQIGDILGTYCNLEIIVCEQEGRYSFYEKHRTVCLHGRVTHRIDADYIFNGRTVLKICEKLREEIPTALQEKKNQLSANELALQSATALLSEPFDQQERLDELKAEFEKLTEDISKSTKAS